MQPTDGGAVKIGFSDNVEARRVQLEATYGRPLVVLAVMEGGRDEERAIHERFAHLRLEGRRRRGRRPEQFQPAPELLAFLGRPLLASANPDAVEAMPHGGRASIILLKGTPEYATWLDEFHRTTHIPKATIVRLAMAEWAVTHGYPAPPEF